MQGMQWVLASALCILLGAGCTEVESKPTLPTENDPTVPPPAIVVSTETSETKSISQKIVATGTLYALRTAQLSPKMAGILKRIHVEEGDTVKEGQLLFELDASKMALQVKQAKAAIAVTEPSVNASKTELERMEKLYQKNAISQTTYDQVQTAYKQANASLEQAKVGLALAYKTSSESKLKAPFDGVITKKQKDIGEYLSTNSIVVVLEQVDMLEARVAIPESALATVKVGTKADIVVGALQKKIEATVKRIQENVDPVTRTVEVILLIDNQEREFRPGMLVEASFEKQTAPGNESQPSASQVKEGANE